MFDLTPLLTLDLILRATAFLIFLSVLNFLKKLYTTRMAVRRAAKKYGIVRIMYIIYATQFYTLFGQFSFANSIQIV